MKVKSLIYNWHQSGSVQDRDGAGENWDRITVGELGVVEIIENKPIGEGDKWNYLVKFENGSQTRIFNPNRVYYIQ